METVKKIAKNTGVLISADVISKVLSLIFFVYLARSLGDTGLGKYSFIFAFVGVFTLFSDLGIVPLLIREVSRDKKKVHLYLYNTLTLRLIATFLTAFLAVFVLFTFESDSEILLGVFLASLAMLFYNFSEVCLALFQAEQRMEYPAFILILERLVTVSLGAYALYLGYGIIVIVSIYFFSYLIMFIATLILTLKIIGKIMLKFDYSVMQNLLKESIPFWLTTIFYTIYFKIDTVMLSFFKGYAPVGWYNASYAILETLIFVPFAVSRAIYPVMSRFYIENKDALKALLKKSFYYMVLLGIPMSIGITLLSERIIFFVYGDEFLNSVYALQILIWAVLLIFMSMISGTFLNAINQQRVFSYITGISAIANVALNFILIPQFSYIGAAIATVITEFLVIFLAFYYVKKLDYGFSISKLIIRPVVASVFMALVITYFRFLNLFILIIVGAVVYLIVLSLVKGIRKEDVDYFKGIFSKN